MKNNPLFSIVTDSADRMFVTDKRGKTVFFPWGSNKQGYYIKSRNLAIRTKKFYKASFVISFVLLIVALSFFENSFWGIVSSMIVWLGGWYFSCFLYVSKVVKSLQPANVSHKELILAKHESEDIEHESLDEQTATQFPAQWNLPTPQTNNDPLLGIKRIWYRLSPGQLFILYIFIGFGIILIRSSFRQQEFGENPIDQLVACIVGVFWGLAGFVVAKNMESDKVDWWGFLNWKLPMILITVACWGFATYSLYKFFMMIFV